MFIITVTYAPSAAARDISLRELAGPEEPAWNFIIQSGDFITVPERKQALLSERPVRNRGIFNPKAVRQMILDQRSGRHDYSMQIRQLPTLELWMQAFVDPGKAKNADHELPPGSAFQQDPSRVPEVAT